jgi:dihydroorotate dehydrogenase (fumarate)/dihydropyrimidine dehydrogenase (NAD+) subunit PreA
MIGQVPDIAAEVTRQVCDAVDIPVMVKLTPDQSPVLEVARVVRESGASAVNATNRYTGFAVDIETGKPRLGGMAGVGGPWTKPLSLRWVHRIRNELGIPVSGSNGIFDHRDVVEFIMTGAGIVQVGSVLMLKGIKWLPHVIRGLGRFMDEHGYADVATMRGIASGQAARDYDEQFRKARIHAKVHHEVCQNPTCTVCIQMCFYEALSQHADGYVEVRTDNCIGCELCYDVCPFGAISLHPTTPEQLAAGFYDVPEGVYEHGKFDTQRNHPAFIGLEAIKKRA